MVSPAVLILLSALLDLVGGATCAAVTHARLSGATPLHPALLAAPAILVAAFALQGLYSHAALFGERRILPLLVQGWLAACGAVALLGLMHLGGGLPRETLPLLVGVLAVPLATRLVWHWLGPMLLRHLVRPERIAVIGPARMAGVMLQQLAETRHRAVRLVAVVDPEIMPGQPPFLDSIETLIGLIRDEAVDAVLVSVAGPGNGPDRGALHRLAMTPVTVRLVSDLAGLGLPHSAAGSQLEVTLLRPPLSGSAAPMKRLEDIVISVLLLGLALPALLLIALAIRLDGRGPVLVWERRYGLNNRLIRVWQFRTARDHPARIAGAGQPGGNDPPMIRGGAFLRSHSLDQVPQLLNVLRGDMSLVGPLPHAVLTNVDGQLLEAIADRYMARHRVKPGITGWAQVNGWRGRLDSTEKVVQRVEHDLYYIENWSLWLDLKIIAATAAGAFRNTAPPQAGGTAAAPCISRPKE